MKRSFGNLKDLQWSLRCKTAPSAGLTRSLVGVRSHIGVHFVLKILLGAEGGRSHKTSRSYNRWSYNAGTTVYCNGLIQKTFIVMPLMVKVKIQKTFIALV